MEIETNEKAIVITGGPGMGKTSIIKQLAQMGYPSMAVTDYTNTLNQKQYTFFDRGLPDVIGYLALLMQHDQSFPVDRKHRLEHH